MKILVADDSKPIRALLAALLEDAGHEVVTVTDGAAALAALEQKDSPRLAIIDWHMPVLDGLTVCQRIRAMDGNAHRYLILLTVKSSRAEILDGLRSGVDDYITKPFDEEALIARVKIGERIVDLQTMLGRRVCELEQSNQELEAFGRMVAHDLRNPLGAIESLSEILREEAQGAGTRGLLPLIEDVHHSAIRARETVEDLLKLSRAALSEVKLAEVDLSGIVEGISLELGRTAPERQVEWQIPTGVRVCADEGLLRLAVDNLVRNAWKFSKHCEPAIIAFGVLGEDEHAIYFIRDNGAGFDMAKAGRLFGAFQRLHDQQEFEGTGIGLTIVKRIIERHGGRIWAQSVPGQGAAFFFTLGERQPAAQTTTSTPPAPALAA